MMNMVTAITHPGYRAAMEDLWMVHQAMKPLVEGYELVHEVDEDLGILALTFVEAADSVVRNELAGMLAHVIMSGRTDELHLLQLFQSLRVPKDTRTWDLKAKATEITKVNEGWPLFYEHNKGMKQ